VLASTHLTPVRFVLSLALSVPLLTGCGGDAESAADAASTALGSSYEGAVGETAASAPSAELPSSPPSPPSAPAMGGAATAPRPSAATPAATPPAAEPTGPTAPAPLAIQAGTQIPALMETTLSTRTHQAGAVFYARVTEEILAADGMVLVPEGSRIEGRVTEARVSNSSEEQALLLLSFDAILVRGERIPLSASVTAVEIETSAGASGARSAATVATGAAVGAVVGQILGRDTRSTVSGAAVGAVAGAGVALTTRDGHAEIREGSQVTIRLDAPALLAGDR